MFCLILKGPSAVGKSTISAYLFNYWYDKIKIAQIHGGYLQSMISKKQLTAKELDLKYILMNHFIVDLSLTSYNIIIQDIFRRGKDLRAVVDCAESNFYDVLVINLTASFLILKRRNRQREPLDYKTNEKLLKNYYQAASVSYMNEFTINTGETSIRDTAREIINQIICRV